MNEEKISPDNLTGTIIDNEDDHGENCPVCKSINVS